MSEKLTLVDVLNDLSKGTMVLAYSWNARDAQIRAKADNLKQIVDELQALAESMEHSAYCLENESEGCYKCKLQTILGGR